MADEDLIESEDSNDVETPPPPSSFRRRHRSGIEWGITLAAAALAAFLVHAYVFQTFTIPSSSMTPTLQIGDRIIVDKLSVRLGTVNIGDIIVFKAPPKAEVPGVCADVEPIFVKRVIGLPNDRIYSIGNQIFIAAPGGKFQLLHQNWTIYPAMGSMPIASPSHPYHVPAGTYYVMGDDHANSCDSRYWGTVPHANIIGKAFLRIWPLSRIAWF